MVKVCWQQQRLLGSVRSQSGSAGELTLTAIKPTFTSVAGTTSNVGEPWDSGQSHCHPRFHDGNDRSLSARKTLIDPLLTYT